MPRKLHNIFLILYSFVLPFEYWDPFGLVGSFSIVRMIAIVYFMLSIVNYNYSFIIKGIGSYVGILLTLLITLIFSNLLSGISVPEYRPVLNTSFFQNIILFWIVGNHLRNDPRLFNKVFLSFAFGIVALGILFSFGIGLVYRGDRLSVFGDNPNNQATKVAVGICLLIYFILRDSFQLRIFRYLFLIPIPILLNFIAESGSRGGLLTLFLGLGLIIYLFPIQSKTRKFVFYIICLIGGIYLSNVIFSNEIISKRMQEFAEEGSLGGREDIWEVTIDIFRKSPIIGVGESGFVHNMIQSVIGTDKSAHNYFLYVITTSGIIGFVFFLWFLSKIFKASRELIKYEEILQFSLFFIVVFAMFRSGGSLGDKFYWFVFASIIGYYLSFRSELIENSTVYESVVHD